MWVKRVDTRQLWLTPRQAPTHSSLQESASGSKERASNRHPILRCASSPRKSPSGLSLCSARAYHPSVVFQALLTTRWNFPLAVAVRKMGAALAAGCTVVIKPSPETPITTIALAQLAQRAGYSEGVINVVPASVATTPAVGKKLCEDRRIKKLSFTGSTAVGRLLMSQASGSLKKMTLELGGNGGWIVFEDADLERAADGEALAYLITRSALIPPSSYDQ